MIWKYKIEKLHDISSTRKYCIVLVDRQTSCAQQKKDPTR